jgi:hypothetical protein
MVPIARIVCSLGAAVCLVLRAHIIEGLVLGEERQTTEGDADWLNSTPTRAPLMILVDSSSASSNAEPAHNITKYFVPNLR